MCYELPYRAFKKVATKLFLKLLNLDSQLSEVYESCIISIFKGDCFRGSRYMGETKLNTNVEE